MKKLLLFLVICSFTGFISGQQSKHHLEIIPDKSPDPAAYAEQQAIIGQKLSESNIGSTIYDLQTYAAMQKRIYAYPDGTIGAIWMMALEGPPDWIDRGAGYNYFDGSEWGEYPTERIESMRTGWPCYAPLGVNGEVIASHALSGDDWVILINWRENKGQGDWIESEIGGPEAEIGIVWPDMVTGGTDHNTIHLLVRTYNANAVPFMGQDGALLYSRSSDGGVTWDILNHFFEELGPDYFVNIDANGYSWAQPRGNTIAFSVGFDAGPACIMKSLDNGDTWVKINVYESPFYPPPGGATVDFGAGDGTQALAIDSDNNVHVVYGRMVCAYNDAGELGLYPDSEGLIYWNESMPVLDSTIVSSYTLDYLIAGGNLAGQIVEPGISGILDIPNYWCSLTSHPQMLIDDNDRILVLWSGAAPGYVLGTKNYRHIYGNSSNDGGLTWNAIVDFNDALLYSISECVFPAMAPMLINNEFHFIFQNDEEPGMLVWAASQVDPTNNYITHMSYDVSFLTDVKAHHNQATGKLIVSQNFPNPFEMETFIDVSVEKPENISLIVSDVAGRTVYSDDYGRITNTKLRIRFENNYLPAGIYYYTVTSDSGSFAGKMMVK